MEELRDERLSKIIGWLQSYIRGYIARKDFKKLQDQRLVNFPSSIKIWNTNNKSLKKTFSEYIYKYM